MLRTADHDSRLRRRNFLPFSCVRERRCLAVFLLAGSISANGQAVAQSLSESRPSFPPVSLQRTQLRHLRSERVGQDYQIRVWFPEGYETSTKRYPVLYLMDGDLMFGMATEIVQYLQWGGTVPELIIVSPAYGSIHGPENGGTNMRTRDFSVFPTQSRYVQDGGEKFLRFLREELIPYVDREFRTDSADRTLAGFSRGADFTVYTLLTAPDVFHRYISIDSFNSEYFTHEEALAARRKDLAKKVFLSSRYPMSGVYEFSEKLKSRGYTGLNVEYAVATPRHFAAAGDGLTRGLTSVFNKPSIYELLLPMVTEKKIDAGLSEYRRLKLAHAESYNFGENELVDLGNALVLMRRAEDAIRVFRLNLENHPQSSNTFSRLGAAHEKLGENKKALENYRRALQLNPTDRNAAEAIKRLEAR